MIEVLSSPYSFIQVNHTYNLLFLYGIAPWDTRLKSLSEAASSYFTLTLPNFSAFVLSAFALILSLIYNDLRE